MSDYVTRAELHAILEDYSARSAEHLSATLTRTLSDLAAQLAPLATVEDLGRRFDASMAQVLAYGAEVGHAAAVAVARDAVAAYTQRMAESLQVTLNVPEGLLNVTVEPTPVLVENHLELPTRKTTTTVERDHRGLIAKTTATESDV